MLKDMIARVKAKLKGIYLGYDYEKYWACRDALFDPRTNKLKFWYCKHYVSVTNRKNNADIAYNLAEGNNFKGHLYVVN